MILEVLDPWPGDLTVSWLPLSHDMGLIGMLLAPGAGGASLYTGGAGRAFLMRPESFLALSAKRLRYLSRERSATVTVAPSFALDLVRRCVRGY